MIWGIIFLKNILYQYINYFYIKLGYISDYFSRLFSIIKIIRTHNDLINNIYIYIYLGMVFWRLLILLRIFYWEYE